MTRHKVRHFKADFQDIFLDDYPLIPCPVELTPEQEIEFLRGRIHKAWNLTRNYRHTFAGRQARIHIREYIARVREIKKALGIVDYQRTYSAKVRNDRELREEIEAEAADVRNWLGAADLDYSDDRPSAGMQEHRPG